MADSKLTDLTALTLADLLDLLYLVDVSDTTDHASGTSKKMTFANIIASLRGKIVQIQSSIDGVYASGTTTIPLDDTIPQSNEGTQLYTVNITPTNASNKLLLLTNLCLFPSASVNASSALFQDNTADAIAVSNPAYLGGGTWEMLHIYHLMAAGTTSQTTFKLRCGPATAATVYCNGNASARLFGGRMRSGIICIELGAD